MSRDLTTAFTDALDAVNKSPVIFYEGEFSTGTVRMWSGMGDISWNSVTWLGAGHLGEVSPIRETNGIEAVGISVSLSGVPSALVNMALDESRQGKPGKVWIGLLDASGDVIADPSLHFTGRLDVPTVNDDGETAIIKITYESHLRDLERPREHRYTDESHKVLYPTDKFFEFVPSLQEWNGVWGRS